MKDINTSAYKFIPALSEIDGDGRIGELWEEVFNARLKKVGRTKAIKSANAVAYAEAFKEFIKENNDNFEYFYIGLTDEEYDSKKFKRNEINGVLKLPINKKNLNKKETKYYARIPKERFTILYNLDKGDKDFVNVKKNFDINLKDEGITVKRFR